MRLLICWLALALTVTGALADPAPPQAQRAATYFFVRDRAKLAKDFTLDEILTQPQKFEGLLVEVRGTISGIALSGDRLTLVIGSAETGAGMAVALPADKPISTWPFLAVGSEIRALCGVVTYMGSPNGSLELTTAVEEVDAQETDRQRRKAGGHSEDDETGYAPSRYTDAELVAIYANALRYFNRQLSSAWARQLSWALIRSSRDDGLDARLLLAVLVTEKKIDGVFSDGATLLIGGVDQRRVVQIVADDLRRRIRRFATTDQITAEVVGHALTERGRAVALAGGRTRLRAPRYGAAVKRLYIQLCGADLGSSTGRDPATLAARWKRRSWSRHPSERLIGTWTGTVSLDLAVFNRDGSGILGGGGGVPGRWYVSGAYLEFRDGTDVVYRGKWRVSDDRKTLLLTYVHLDGRLGHSSTFFRK